MPRTKVQSPAEAGFARAMAANHESDDDLIHINGWQFPNIQGSGDPDTPTLDEHLAGVKAGPITCPTCGRCDPAMNYDARRQEFCARVVIRDGHGP